MTYEAWRISYQSSEQAARAAYAECEQLRAKVEAMERQKPVVTWAINPHDKYLQLVWDEGFQPVAGTCLYALPGAQSVPSVPDGWKLVPIEPTEKMVNEGSCASTLPGPRYISEECAKQCWEYMIKAAPEAKP